MQGPFCSAMVAIGYVYSHAGLATLLLAIRNGVFIPVQV